jgi:MarR family transcriptional regulator for hemolysin
MGGPALVRHIDRLEADGIVTRTRDADDRRIISLELTAKGRRYFDRIRAVMATCDERLRAVLTEKEADVMQRALDKILAFCQAELGVSEPPASRRRT